MELAESIKEDIKNMFSYYKIKGTTLKTIANKFKVDATTVGKIFHKKYGEEFKRLAKYKQYEHSLKDDKEKIFELFNIYKNGADLNDLAKSLNIKRGSLQDKFLNRFGKEYINIAKTRVWKKVPFRDIEKAFIEYKNKKVSLAKLAKKLEMAESSLTARFNNHFKEEYKKVAISRKDERKVTKNRYIKAFEEYENTPISLTSLAKYLGIRISSLRPKFIRLFGDRYHKIAKEKLEGAFLTNRGEIAEKLALEYLKILGIEVEDIRKKCLIKNTLKRPDFITGENFIEVKSYFIKYSNKRLKGYREILDSYLNKELKDGGVLRSGIIISLGGFSDKVKEDAIKDNITLIDNNDLKRKFEETNRYDLINILENHFLPRCEL